MNIEMLKLGAWCKYIFSVDFRIKISENYFGVLGWALIVYILELGVEGIFKYIVLALMQNVAALSFKEERTQRHGG